MKREDKTQDAPRKPYEAPRVVESGSFEKLVLACGKLQDEGPGAGWCPAGASS